jgi:hypothetical protein
MEDAVEKVAKAIVSLIESKLHSVDRNGPQRLTGSVASGAGVAIELCTVLPRMVTA